MAVVPGSREDDDEPLRPSSARRRPIVWLAGAVLSLVGAGNAAFGVLALTTDRVALSGGSATTLAALGVVTLALGVLVATGRRWAMLLALVVFGGLFGIQALRGSGGAPAPAVVTLAIVLLPLVLAIRATRPVDPPDAAADEV